MSDSVSKVSTETTLSGEVFRGVLAALPVMIGILPFGLLLGAQAAQKGFTAGGLSLLTGLNFAGGSEFAAIALWTSPPPLLTIVLVSLLVNSRHLLMGASLAPTCTISRPGKRCRRCFSCATSAGRWAWRTPWSAAPAGWPRR